MKHVLFIVLSLLITIQSAEVPAQEPDFYENELGFAPMKEKINGRTFYFYFPENIKGIIYIFHGAGGSARNWFMNIEKVRFIHDAVKKGFGIAVPESLDRNERRWDFKETGNPDIDLLGKMRNLFISGGTVSGDISQFGIGMSNGGYFVVLAGYSLGFRGLAVYSSPGHMEIFEKEDFNIPVVFNIGASDPFFPVEEIEENGEFLKNKGVSIEINIRRKKTLSQRRFTRIPGVKSSRSKEIFSIFKDNGFLDERNYLSIGDKDRNWIKYLPAKYNSIAGDILGQLIAVNGGHTFMSDFNKQTLKMFEKLSK